MTGAYERDDLSPVKRALLEIRDLRGQLARVEAREHAPIAIVGAGLRFPGGATDPESYWRLLADGVDAIGPIPPDRWDVETYYDPEPGASGKMYTRLGGFLNDIDQFDPFFFDISPREAERMDPQQRLLLETAWEALERANIAADRLAGSRAGVYIGMANSDYFRLMAAYTDNADLYLATGNAFSIAAGRLAYTLGLSGPAMAVDTACSSSLVAVHLAVQSLRRGETDLALAGGVNLILSPEANISFSHARMMAPDGRCKTFDAGADGYVRSEGCGVVALKRLADAEADGDPILAVIRGSAINQDGRSNGLTAPNGPSQEAVIRAALADAGLTPRDVHYVEAHGTGTSLGDPIEARALGAALGERDASNPLLIGAVKTNLGHLEAAAGIASLIKVALMLEHGQVPPSLHLTEPSPHIPWDELPLQVPTTLQPWPGNGEHRVAGVSSFGFSGTNAHLLLEAPPPTPAASQRSDRDRPVRLLPLSATSSTALDALAGRYAAHLRSHPELTLAEVTATAGQGRAHHAERLVVMAADPAQAIKRLDAVAAGAEGAGVKRGRRRSESPTVAFLFTGQGAQYAGMGKDLYATEPIFHAALDRCAELLAPHLDQPLLDVIFAEPDTPEAALLDETAYTQPALFAIEYALAQLWQSWGVQPVAVAGHSLGEYTAACVAGVMSLEDATRLVAARGRLMGAVPPGGAMAAVFASETRIAEVLGTLADQISIAAVNGPRSVTLSGDKGQVEEAVARLQAEGLEARLLAISLAAHSPLVDPILDEFEAEVALASLTAPSIALVSCLTGELVDDEVTTSRYWRQHLREPVRFGTALETLCELGCTAFIEIGPHPVLLGMARHAISENAGIWLPSLRRDRDEWEQVLESLGDLYVAGGAIDWNGVAPGDARHATSLPTYPFQRQRYWAAPTQRAERDGTPNRWSAVSGGARRQSEQGPLDLDAASYPARWEALDHLATAHIVRALRSLELFVEPDERHSPAEIIERGIALSTYCNVLNRWLGRLADDGLLAREGDAFVAIQPLPEPTVERAEAEATQALAGVEPLLDFALRGGRQLESVLTGAISPLDLLFPGGSYSTSDFMYQEWAAARYVNGIVRAAVESLAAATPNRPLRLLEIGAGTGGTTAQVLPVVPAERGTYDFTDVSDFFLTRARERFAEYPFVRYGLLDVERSPEDQGYAPCSYDVVIAANVLHATRDLDCTLQHVQELLAPGGVLLLLEATHHPHWFDITIGLVEGWQAFDDAWRDDIPLIAADRWGEALRAAGFIDVLGLPEAGALTEALGQHVIIARAPGDTAPNGLSGALDEAALLITSTSEITSASPETNGVPDQLNEALPGERHDVLTNVVSKLVARVLRAEPDRSFPSDQRLLELGLDSLMAVELRDQIGRALALPEPLPATLIFDYPSIASIATYLEHDVLWPGQRAAEATSTAPPLAFEQVADLTDEEIERLLVKKLERL